VIFLIIDKYSHIPVYYQIKNYILEKITSDEWEKDKPIPSERELCELMKVSRMTVRQAIGELEKDGILYKIRGKGTFIAKSKIEQKNIMSFSELVKSKGIKPSTDILEFGKDIVNLDIAKAMGVDSETLFYKIKRLRKADGEPVAIEEVFVPMHYCPDIEKYDLTGSLYEILHDEYNYKIDEIILNIDAIMPSEYEQKFLKVDKNVPLLKAEGISITSLGKEIFYEISCYRSDKFSYKVSVYSRH